MKQKKTCLVFQHKLSYDLAQHMLYVKIIEVNEKCEDNY